MKTLSQILRLLVLTSLMATAQAQEVSIPDPGLNAAIRGALQNSGGPLTTQDLLSLTNLYARGIGVRSLEGLEAAHNLTTLSLDGSLTNNRMTSLTLTAGLASLTVLFLDGNPLTALVVPEPLAVASLAGTVESLRNQGVSV